MELDLSLDELPPQKVSVQPPAHADTETGKPLAARTAMPDGVARAESRKESKHHRRSCSLQGCTRCKWFRLSMRFSKASRLQAPEGAHLSPAAAVHVNTTWCLAGIAADGKWGLGCKACSAVKGGVKDPMFLFANFTACRAELQPKQLARHAETKEHAAAVKAFFGQAQGPTGSLTGSAPPALEFRSVLSKLAAGESLRAVAGGVQSTKTHAIAWCLAEAMKEKDREFLKDAVSMVLCRDERQERLLVRFGAVDSKFNVRRGFLGQCKDAGGKGTNLVQGTRKVLRDFCTAFHEPPRTGYSGNGSKPVPGDGVSKIGSKPVPGDGGSKIGSKPELGARVTPKLDRELAKHLQERIEVIVTDSAANELLAGDIGRGRREGHAEDLDATASAQPDLRAQLTETLTPNLILIGRDCAHCFRRHSYPNCQAKSYSPQMRTWVCCSY